MLLRIREITAGKFSYFIIAIISVPFALWGISYYFEGGFDPVVIEVGSVEVTLGEFNQQFNQRKRDFSARADESGMPSDSAIKQEVVNAYVREGLLVHDAEQYDYRVPDDVLARSILEMPEFWVDNRFDKELYLHALRSRQLSQSDFERSFKESLRRGQLRSVVEESSFILPYEDRIYEQFMFEERRARYVEIPVSHYTRPDSVVASTEVEVYYVENEEQFSMADSFVVQYIELNVEDIAAGLVAEESEVRSYYDRNLEMYSAPEQRRFAHILIDPEVHGEDESEKLAREIHGKLERGEDFSGLAADYSDDVFTAESGGELPPLARDDLEDEIAEAIFDLDAGDFSEPVKSPFGWQIFRLLGVEAVAATPFEEAREEIEEHLRLNLAEQAYSEGLEQLRLFAYEYPESLEDVASQMTTIAEVKLVGPLDISQQEDLFQYEKIRDVVYSEQVFKYGENSEVIEVGEGHSFVVRIGEGGYTPGRLRTFDEARDEIMQLLLEKDAREHTRASLREILNQLQEKQITLDELILRESFAVHETDFVRRNNEQLPPSLTVSLFLMPATVGQYGVALLDSQTSYGIIELLEVRQGEFFQHEKPDLSKIVEEYQAVLSALLEGAKVEIDSEAILGEL